MKLSLFALKKFVFPIIYLVWSPLFFMLFFLGNGIVLLCAFLMYQIEAGTNPDMGTFLDAVWWAFATVTTVGYGDITPVTMPGKIIGIFLMLGGTALFATYTALFANALLEREIGHVQHELEVDENIFTKRLEKIENKLDRLINQRD